MRALVIAFTVLTLHACTCGGCAKTPATPPDASAAVQPLAQTPTADANAAPDELPPELTHEGAPTDEAVLAAYLANCHADIEVTYEDMDGSQTKLDCDALAFDQNCSPDTFGCWTDVENCRHACANPCKTCQSRCGDTCETCASTCGTDPACRKACATRRAECRKTCLYEVQHCRADTCTTKYQQCEADAASRTQKLCPDCEAISACLQEKFGTGAPGEGCLIDGNAKECVEWCSPGP